MCLLLYLWPTVKWAALLYASDLCHRHTHTHTSSPLIFMSPPFLICFHWNSGLNAFSFSPSSLIKIPLLLLLYNSLPHSSALLQLQIFPPPVTAFPSSLLLLPLLIYKALFYHASRKMSVLKWTKISMNAGLKTMSQHQAHPICKCLKYVNVLDKQDYSSACFFC